MKICDIRHWQGEIDWEKARKELSLAIFRATKDKIEDPMYLRYTSECDIPYGAYCYLQASNAAEAREEARVFVEVANKAIKQPLFYIGDIEHENQNEDNTEEICFAFLDELRILRCARIGLYINTRFPYCGAALNLCDIIWMPHWGDNDGQIPPDDRKPKYYCDLWQYTSYGQVDGIKTRADLNILNGNKPLSWFITDVNSKLGTRLLKIGKKGEDVEDLQTLLNELLEKNLVVDGDYGIATKLVVGLFQTQENLEADGIYGPLTHKALIDAITKKRRTQQIVFPSFIIASRNAAVYSGNDTKFETIITLDRKFRICPIFNKNWEPVIVNNYMAINCGDRIGWIDVKNLIEVKKDG